MEGLEGVLGRDPMPRQASSENTKAFVLGMPLGFSLLVTPLDTLQWTLRHRWKQASGWLSVGMVSCITLRCHRDSKG